MLQTAAMAYQLQILINELLLNVCQGHHLLSAAQQMTSSTQQMMAPTNICWVPLTHEQSCSLSFFNGTDKWSSLFSLAEYFIPGYRTSWTQDDWVYTVDYTWGMEMDFGYVMSW